MFRKSTGSKEKKFSDENYQLQKLIHVILQIICCIKSDNIILRFPECFELWLTFGFEQSNFDYEKHV